MELHDVALHLVEDGREGAAPLNVCLVTVHAVSMLPSMPKTPNQEPYSPFLVVLDDSIEVKLARVLHFVDVRTRLGLHSDPANSRQAFADGREVVEGGLVRPVLVLDLGGSHERSLDRLDELQKDGRGRRGGARRLLAQPSTKDEGANGGESGRDMLRLEPAVSQDADGARIMEPCSLT